MITGHQHHLIVARQPVTNRRVMPVATALTSILAATLLRSMSHTRAVKAQLLVT